MRLIKVKWADRMRYDGLLTRIGEKRKLITAMRKRKAFWLGMYCVEIVYNDESLREREEEEAENLEEDGQDRRKWKAPSSNLA